MQGSVRWSLIVPSHNGEDTLHDCLESLAGLRHPADGLELLVVDNASSDRTASLLQEFARRSGAVFLTERRKGKSYALNTAIERATGEMLVLLDDDVIADSCLIEAYADAARDFPDAGILAGQVRPSWRADPPAWLETLTDAGRTCGCTPLGLEPGWLGPLQVKGGNMALRRTALGAHRFATVGVNFGAGARAVGGEDTELVRRVANASRIRCVPEARVQHIVGREEMRWKGVFSRSMRIGRGNAAQGLMTRSAFSLVAQAAAYAGLAGTALLLNRRQAAASEGMKLAMRLGALDYRLRPRSDA